MDEGELEPAPSEEVDERSRVRFAEGDAQARIAAVEIGEDAGQAPFRQRLKCRAETDRAAPAAGEGLHLLGGALGLEQDSAGAHGETLAGFRQPSGPRTAFQQRHAQLPLEAPDLLREGGLSHMQPAGGGGKAHRVGDGEEVAEVSKLHSYSANLSV